jgi:hypothetical protein
MPTVTITRRPHNFTTPYVREMPRRSAEPAAWTACW